MGDQSGALVAMDCLTGDMLAFVSMPAYDPNSFTDGIGRTEWRMLSEDDHIPLLNKVAQGALSAGIDDQAGEWRWRFLKQGIDPDAARPLRGRLPARQPLFPLRRGATARSTCARAIERSCNTYFYAMGLHRPIPSKRPRWSNISAMARNSTCRSRPRATARCPTAPGMAAKEEIVIVEWQD